ncbi:MAG: GTPase Era [Cellvibrionaceae bacterium]
MTDIFEQEPSTDESQRCGYVAIVGRPNVGKSTLLNCLLGQKISITSSKPQTTRHNVLGIKTESNYQIIFVDTPGLHKGHAKALNRYMNRAATTAVKDVDVICFLVDRMAWTEEDEMVAERLENTDIPVLLLVNKVDQLSDKEDLLPYLQSLSERLKVEEIIPISALKGKNIEPLETELVNRLPENIHFYPEEQITDRSMRFLAAEIVREKITRLSGDELPYQIAVEIEEFAQEGAVLHISALILVERKGQKRIIIGDKGEAIKRVGKEARQDMEKLFDSKVMLNLWVKVKAGWSDDERALRSLGYDDI